MRIKDKLEYKIGTNPTVFKKLHKRFLERKGEIRCSYCGWNCNENSSDKWYGGHYDPVKGGYTRMRYPSWKLATKNKKQWQEKPKTYKITEEVSRFRSRTYYEIHF